MTKLERETIRAIRAWCESHGNPATRKLRHVHPRAYVLGRAASQCLLVSVPLIDAEPQIRRVNEVMQADGSMAVHVFDDTLRAGDWCSVAYVTSHRGGESVAIRAVTP